MHWPRNQSLLRSWHLYSFQGLSLCSLTEDKILNNKYWLMISQLVLFIKLTMENSRSRIFIRWSILRIKKKSSLRSQRLCFWSSRIVQFNCLQTMIESLSSHFTDKLFMKTRLPQNSNPGVYSFLQKFTDKVNIQHKTSQSSLNSSLTT